MNTEEEKALMQRLREKKEAGIPLTDHEKLMWGYSQYGSGNPLGSGGCYPGTARPPVVDDLVEPISEN